MKRLAFILSLILLFGPLALTTSAAQQNDSATQHRDSTQRDDSATQRRDSTVRRGNVGDREEAQEQTSKGARIFDEIMGIPEGGIPQSILDGAECIAVFPSVIKGGFFLFGGRGGKGLVSCRDTQTGTWGPPVFLKIGGGSFGPQIGGEAVDL
ncbi:MAG: hypothetical protein HY314_02675, partial [Acidobacteria bacterium]|nr:hypothetical protein [Acidobacteriota bacterium]